MTCPPLYVRLQNLDELRDCADYSRVAFTNIGASVEETSDTISEITRSLNTREGTMGVADINETIVDLNKKEELVSRCLESQLPLARAARYSSRKGF